jgi:hypothetical protein
MLNFAWHARINWDHISDISVIMLAKNWNSSDACGMELGSNPGHFNDYPICGIA